MVASLAAGAGSAAWAQTPAPAAPMPPATAAAPAPGTVPASFTEAQLRAAAYMAANCANCHGTAGKGAVAMPALAGLPRSYLVQQMRDFRDGRRGATLMHQIAKGYTDEQYELLGEYFARQKSQ